jgi:hypothetical protein
MPATTALSAEILGHNLGQRALGSVWHVESERDGFGGFAALHLNRAVRREEGQCCCQATWQCERGGGSSQYCNQNEKVA